MRSEKSGAPSASWAAALYAMYAMLRLFAPIAEPRQLAGREVPYECDDL